MKNEVLKECYDTADRIINILDELGYSTEKVPAYSNLLRDLISIEIKKNITNVTTLFYNNVAVHPIVKTESPTEEDHSGGGCCGGESDDCGCK